MSGSTDCWHCHSPLPHEGVVTVRVAGQDHAVCCQGCRAAAQWIDQLGLADYYRLRTEPAARPEASAADYATWDRSEVARHVVRDLGQGRSETVVLIDGVRCAACVWLIERALAAVPGIERVQVNAVARRARIVWEAGRVSLPQILKTLSLAGYRALPLDARALDDVRRAESHSALKRLLVAGFGAMQAMMYATILYLGAIDPDDLATRELFRWLGFVVATPVVFYSAQPFFAGAVRSLRAHRLGMDVPVALAVALIYIASLVEALTGGVEVYFDSVSMFVFFLLLGRYIEMRARHQAGDLTDALARLTPPFADRVGADGVSERVGIHELKAGDRVRVAEGGIVPADGTLESGRCRVDESLLTGESAPVPRRRGEPLKAGSLLVEGPAVMGVEQTGAGTMLAGIATLVERARAERPRLASAGERAAARFIARVMTLTVLTALVWTLIESAHAFSAALAVLVVSCPCAFALAVPAAITRAIGVMARCGMLVVRPDALEALAGATHVVFDKTGTLTESGLAPGQIRTRQGVSHEEATAIAAGLARASRHPAARAIAAAAGVATDVGEVTAHAGLGLSATANGRAYRLGRPDFALAGQAVPAGCDAAVVLADEDGMLAAFFLDERLRADAADAITTLRSQGLKVLIASGDAPEKVAAAAGRLGIIEWRARLLPDEKLAWLKALREQGARVVMVGDGINDAPFLAGAEVAVALGGGAELAQAASDIVLTGERLTALPEARRIAAQALAILRQNQRWALGYNLSAVPLAALGFVPPWLAALGMSLSSLVVVVNALRIGREPPKSRAAAAESVPRVGMA